MVNLQLRSPRPRWTRVSPRRLCQRKGRTAGGKLARNRQRRELDPWNSEGFSRVCYPLVICYIAIEHGPFIVDLPMKMVIFHSYVSLPEFVMFFFPVNMVNLTEKMP